MPRFVAFLRAINVGGHVVTMNRLEALFEDLGFDSVESFIASGNVLFNATADSAKDLERQIESHLHAALGYQVPTFLRSPEQLNDIAFHLPFPRADLDTPGHALYVHLLPTPLNAAVVANILQLRTSRDDFHVHDREVYWLSRGKISESPIKTRFLERVLGLPTTSRNMSTIRRIVDRIASSR